MTRFSCMKFECKLAQSQFSFHFHRSFSSHFKSLRRWTNRCWDLTFSTDLIFFRAEWTQHIVAFVLTKRETRLSTSYSELSNDVDCTHVARLCSSQSRMNECRETEWQNESRWDISIRTHEVDSNHRKRREIASTSTSWAWKHRSTHIWSIFNMSSLSSIFKRATRLWSSVSTSSFLLRKLAFSRSMTHEWRDDLRRVLLNSWKTCRVRNRWEKSNRACARSRRLTHTCLSLMCKNNVLTSKKFCALARQSRRSRWSNRIIDQTAQLTSNLAIVQRRRRITSSKNMIDRTSFVRSSLMSWSNLCVNRAHSSRQNFL